MGNINATYLDIVNWALVDLGETPKSTWAIGSGADTIEVLIDNVLKSVAKYALRRYPWNSASTWKSFDSDDAATLPDQSVYNNAYTLPTDYLRLNGVPFNANGYPLRSSERPPEWTESARLLMTFVATPQIHYVYYTEIDASPDTASNWSSDLQRYISLELAKRICHSATGDVRAIKESLKDDIRMAFIDATLSDEAEAARQSNVASLVTDAPYETRGFDG